MGDDDLIRRGSVLERLDLAEHDAEERDWRSGANEIARIRKYVRALAAIARHLTPGDDLVAQATAADLDGLLHAARELAQYASYAEIVGGISVNRPQVRQWCDAVFAAIKTMPEDKDFEPVAPNITTLLARISVLTATVREAERERDRVADINRNLCNSHNTLLVDGSNWQRRAEDAEAEAATLRDRLARMEGALQDIAKQKKTMELETEYDAECADFEGGYDTIIDIARAALTDGGSNG